MARVDALQRVTLTLADLLLDRMERRTNLVVTCGIPRRSTAETGPRLNLFMYSVRENPAFRNDEDPRRAASGAYGVPPLALELGYLLTTYSTGNGTPIAGAPANLPADSLAELDAQEILADAMRVFHDHPMITRNTPRLHVPPGTPGTLLDPALQDEFESLRVTPRQFSLDEAAKLWTALKEDYQRSVAYEVSIVRVEQTRPSVAAAPVITRAIMVQPAVSLGPGLSGLTPDAVAATELVTLQGERLSDPTLAVVVSDLVGTGFPANPLTLAVVRDAKRVHFSFPNNPASLMPGPKQVVATKVVSPGHRYASPPQVVKLLPRVDAIAPLTGPFNDTIAVTLDGALLGQAPVPNRPAGPLVPTVLFGNYAIPAADVDYSHLPDRLIVTLAAPGNPSDVASPRPGQTLAIRVRTNGVESRSWRVNPVTQAPEPLPGVQFVVA